MSPGDETAAGAAEHVIAGGVTMVNVGLVGPRTPWFRRHLERRQADLRLARAPIGIELAARRARPEGVKAGDKDTQTSVQRRQRSNTPGCRSLSPEQRHPVRKREGRPVPAIERDERDVRSLVNHHQRAVVDVANVAGDHKMPTVSPCAGR